MKPTKGPWFTHGHIVTNREDYQGTLIADLRKRVPASLFESHVGNADLDFDEITANAFVVAAAWEMLEALEAMRRVFSPRTWQRGADEHAETAACELADAAITKARGPE